MVLVVRIFLPGVLLTVLVTPSLPAQLSPTALVRHAPTLNGRVEGSIQQMTAESVTLNSGASITGDLLIPGQPTVQLNGTPTYGGTVDGTGSPTPSGHKVTLNSGAALRHVVRRTDAVVFPVVAVPPPPAGIRSVSLNNSMQSPGDFATLKNLTLNSNVGPVTVPPGSYGNFSANSGSGFVLGVVGASTPSIYQFQNLTLNSNSTFSVVGPVVVTLNGGFSTNTTMGEASHPEWLQLRIAGGGLSLASNKIVQAHLVAPDGTLTLNGGSRFIGAVTAGRLVVNSSALLRLVAPAVVNGVPFLANFEPTEGYQPGPLDGQNGWAVTGSATVGTALRFAGQQGVTVAPAASAALLVRAFSNSDPRVTFVDLYTRPGAAMNAAAGVFFDTDVASVALTGTAAIGRLQVFNGNGTGGGSWLPTGTGPVLDIVGRSADWFRLTARTDYTAKTWDLYFNGRMIAADLGFVRNTQATFTGLGLSGHATLATGFDDLLVAFENPLFIDSDHDGMEDAWEVAHGLNPAANDRDGDLDSDGLKNIGEYTFGTKPNAVDTDADGLNDAQERTLGTNPNSADTDGDGLPDGWEQQHGFNPVFSDASTDTDSDGLSNFQEYTVGTNPHQADTDSDGMSDAWEIVHELDPLLATDAALDPDGDGLVNLQEFQEGKDPGDFYNGVLPEVTSLLATDGVLGSGDTLSIRVTDAAGQPLVNAPVKFTATVGGHLLAIAPDAVPAGSVTALSDSAGIATVYIKSGGN